MMKEMVTYMEFDGPCPLLMCLAEGRHEHPICPKCGAVAYGNISCAECRRNVDIHRELAIIECNQRSKGER
ncbi:hypothetical protein ES707_03636 [subsurface metagenome]